MPYSIDSDYFSCRMEEEVRRGDEATNERAGTIHYELAHRYGVLAAQCAAGAPPTLSMDRQTADSSPQIFFDVVAAAWGLAKQETGRGLSCA